MAKIKNEEGLVKIMEKLDALEKKSPLVREYVKLLGQMGDYMQTKKEEMYKEAEKYAFEKLKEVESRKGPVERIIEKRIDRTKHLLLIKGAEYCRNNDRLHNFRRASEMERKSMSRVLHGMLQKHLVSYYDMLDDIDGGNIPSVDLVEEKFGDIIVYFHLQEAVIKEIIDRQPLVFVKAPEPDEDKKPEKVCKSK